MFRTFFVVLSCALALTGFVALPASAQLQGDLTNDMNSQLDAAGGKGGAGLVASDPRAIAVSIIRIALGLVGTVLFALNLYAGFLWMTAGGNEEQVAQAKTTIRNATIGLVVVLASYAITLAVTNIVTGNSIDAGANTQLSPEDAAKAGNWSWW